MPTLTHRKIDDWWLTMTKEQCSCFEMQIGSIFLGFANWTGLLTTYQLLINNLKK